MFFFLFQTNQFKHTNNKRNSLQSTNGASAHNGARSLHSAIMKVSPHVLHAARFEFSAYYHVMI